MAGSKSEIDPELLGRVASMTPGQQRWLRTIIASVFSMDDVARETPVEDLPERPKRRARREPARERASDREAVAKGEPLEKVLRGEGVTEEEYPELADELQGIADIAQLLRESGRERRRFGEELLRLLESAEPSENAEDEAEEDDLS